MKLNIFDTLPQMENCCFCISLKMGCIIIAVVYILCIVEGFIGSIASKEFSNCYITGPFTKLISYLAVIICISSFISAVLFLYGLGKNTPKLVLYFLYTTLMLIVFNFITSIIMVFLPNKNCTTPPYFFGGATFFSALLLLYCLVIVNSHYRNMQIVE